MDLVTTLVVRPRGSSTPPQSRIKVLYASSYVHPGVIRWFEYDDVRAEQAELTRAFAAFDVLHRKIKHATALTASLAEYPGIDFGQDEIELTEPFRPLVHRWEALENYRDTTDDADGRADELLLIKALEPAVRNSLHFVAQLKKTDLVSWASLDFVFAPSEIMLAEQDGHFQAYLLTSFQFTVQKNQYTSRVVMSIGVVASLTLHGYHIKNCERAKLCKSSGGLDTRSPVSGRVVVDGHAYYHCQRLVKPALGSLMESRIKVQNHRDPPPIGRPSIFGTPSSNGLRVNSTFDYTTNPYRYGAVGSARVNEREDGLRRLGKQFDTAHASLEHKQTAKVDVDFVEGKGRDPILLMFGPPGAGKTLTAEAVAEECHAPLYSMSASDLGSSPSEVEKSLDSAFESCALCVEGLERNELVSIFLRHLEHYQGVLFLTTNRIQTIDLAFQSRIDLIIPFEFLTPDKFDLSEDDIEKLANMNLNGR
ncbi:putative AAA+ ATPase domain-containing protein [Seiridium cardinale]